MLHTHVAMRGCEAIMDESERHEMIKKYARLKKRKTDIDNEINQIRKQIVDYCEKEQLTEFESGRYRVKLIHQERKEYDDQKLYDALPDPSVWRMISKADTTKISSMIKLNVLNKEVLNDTYKAKRISLLQVEKK